jgi:hypothetical protein
MLLWQSALAQNINSTYSRFGIGQLSPAANVKSLGMGGVQSAIGDGNAINLYNPASYSFLDNTVYQVSGQVNFLRAKTSTESLKYKNANLGEIAIAFRKPSSKWGFAAGMHSYSAIGYSHSNVQAVNDSLKANYKYTGEGGLTEATIGMSRIFVIKNTHILIDSITKKQDTLNYSQLLSIGANMNYLFGNLSQINSVEYNDVRYLGSRVTKNTFAQGILYQGGLLYQVPVKLVLDKKKLVSASYLQIGATYTMGKDIRATLNQVNESTYYGANNAIIINDSSYTSLPQKGRLTIPQRMTVGIAYKKSKAKSGSILLSADYTLQNWSNYKNTTGDANNTNDYFNASAITSVGFEYRPTTAMADNLAHRMQYRFGVKYADTQLVLNNKQIMQKSISAGLSIPLMKGDSKMHLSAEYSMFGTTENNLVQENQLNLWVAFSFSPLRSKERWFYIYQYD